MKRLIYLYSLLCIFTLDSCSVNNTTFDAAVRKVREMIDSGELPPCKYIKIYRYQKLDYGDVFYLEPDDFPLETFCLMPPVRIISHADKYICCIDAYSNDLLPKKKMLDKLGIDSIPYDNNMIYDVPYYIMGVSSNGNDLSIVQVNMFYQFRFRYYVYPELRRFATHADKDSTLFFSLGFDVLVDSLFKEGSSFKGHAIELFACQFYCTDSTLMASYGDSSFFATIYQNDTLKYVNPEFIKDHLFLDSDRLSSFLRKIPLDDDRSSLHQLIKDSTFYFQREAVGYKRYPVIYTDISYEILDESGRYSYIFNDGINDWIKHNSTTYEDWHSD